MHPVRKIHEGVCELKILFNKHSAHFHKKDSQNKSVSQRVKKAFKERFPEELHREQTTVYRTKIKVSAANAQFLAKKEKKDDKSEKKFPKERGEFFPKASPWKEGISKGRLLSLEELAEQRRMKLSWRIGEAKGEPKRLSVVMEKIANGYFAHAKKIEGISQVETFSPYIKAEKPSSCPKKMPVPFSISKERSDSWNLIEEYVQKSAEKDQKQDIDSIFKNVFGEGDQAVRTEMTAAGAR